MQANSRAIEPRQMRLSHFADDAPYAKDAARDYEKESYAIGDNHQSTKLVAGC